MASVNVHPHIDTVTGSSTTPARFTAEAKQASRLAVRVDGADVKFPAPVAFTFDGTAWSAPPELSELPAACYWDTVLTVGSVRKRRTVQVPTGSTVIDYADLIDVTPDTAEPDDSIAQWSATLQAVTVAAGRVASIQAQILDTEASLQALIGQANQAVAAAQAGIATISSSVADADAAAAAAAAAAGAVAADVAGLAPVATSGAYSDLTGKPDLSTIAAVSSVAGRTGAVSLTKTDVNLGNVDNTADTSKPVSTAQAAADATVLATAVQRANHTGTQAASTVTGLAAVATSGTYSSLTGKPTLGTAAAAATSDFDTVGAATAAQAAAVQRANHTGTQTAATIADFTEAVQDAVAGLLTAGSNLTLTYDDTANTLTVAAADGSGLDAEAVRDAIGVALIGVGNITVTVNDAADTITISTTATVNATDAALRDRSTHTGTQSADTLTDGTTNKAFLATERTKLTGVATSRDRERDRRGAP
jgi:hypothetical protein